MRGLVPLRQHPKDYVMVELENVTACLCGTIFDKTWVLVDIVDGCRGDERVEIARATKSTVEDLVELSDGLTAEGDMLIGLTAGKDLVLLIVDPPRCENAN